MSLILKGIDLPIDETIDETIVIYYANRYGEMETVFVDVSDIIQIPKGHGRIGDLDGLRKAIRTDVMGGLNYERFIRDIPTILEAEE